MSSDKKYSLSDRLTKDTEEFKKALDPLLTMAYLNAKVIAAKYHALIEHGVPSEHAVAFIVNKAI